MEYFVACLLFLVFIIAMGVFQLGRALKDASPQTKGLAQGGLSFLLSMLRKK